MKDLSIVVLGAGKMATQLGQILKARDFQIIQLYNRSPKAGKQLAKQLACPFTDKISELHKADLYILAVSDDAIETLAQKLNIDNALLVHTSGTSPLNILKEHARYYGVFYPLQSLSAGRAVDWQQVPILIESNTSQHEEKLLQIAQTLSANVQKVCSEQRQWLHLAAVFACNFSNHLWAVAEELMNSKGLDFSLLKPLIQHSCKQAQVYHPADVQTGPAIRGDQKTMHKQLELLKNNTNLQAIYRHISQSIQDSANKS